MQDDPYDLLRPDDPRRAAADAGWTASYGAAPRIGRWLLVATGGVLLAGAACLGLDARSWAVVAATSATLLVAALLAGVVPWEHHKEATVAFPTAVLGALLTVGLGTEAAGAAFATLIPLCFVYTGLFHRARATVALVPGAAVTYLSMMSAVTATTWVRLCIASSTWLAIGLVLTTTVRSLRRLTRRLEDDVRTDPLTRLANRRALAERLGTVPAGSAVAVLDLDHFKDVNDQRGHAGGDAVLQDFADVLHAELGAGCFVARYGGEEFVVLLPGATAAQARGRIDAVRAAWSRRRSDVTFSAGVAQVTRGTTPEAALAAADAALYRAKADGRNTIRLAR